MSADDRNDPRDDQQSDASLPVEDLQPKPVDDRAADEVRGGAGPAISEITISKHTDQSTP